MVALAAIVLLARTVLKKAWWANRIFAKYEVDHAFIMDQSLHDNIGLKGLIALYFQHPSQVTLALRGQEGGVDADVVGVA